MPQNVNAFSEMRFVIVSKILLIFFFNFSFAETKSLQKINTFIVLTAAVEESKKPANQETFF